MSEIDNSPDTDLVNEQFPIEPSYHPVNKVVRKIYNFLASSKLAMVLLVSVLTCCIIGVTFFRGARAAELVFTTLWFNALLVALIVNVACCFFGRIWGRRITIISFGMILFHLSFVTMFIGIIYNSLFYFRGSMRLTEGETVQNGERGSYDLVARGRFFNLSNLKGETTLNRVHFAYTVDGKDKRRAYDIAVRNGKFDKQSVIYLTKNMEFGGFTYFPEQEGHSILTVLYDKQGKELYGAFIPLQSLPQPDKKMYYTTGTKNGPGTIEFPSRPEKPLFNLQVVYRPDSVKIRVGDAFFGVKPLKALDDKIDQKTLDNSKTPLGARYAAGDFSLSAKEVRYWVSMNVKREPGQPLILGSLWVGLAGMLITTIGRMTRGQRKTKHD